MTTPGAESTNWLAIGEQQFWFERFASPCDHLADGSLALKFQQFQSFLSSAVYCYIEKFPATSSQTSVDQKNDGQCWQTAKSGNNDNIINLNDAMIKLDLSERAEICLNGFSKQQEMHLFRRFDLNNDHLIDRDEFAHLCQKWLHQVFNPTCALVVVDVQNDFIDGSLALINGPAKQDGAEVVPIVNDLVEAFKEHKATIVYTQDWHPQDHVSFHANLYLRKHIIKETTTAHSKSDDGTQQRDTAVSNRNCDIASPQNQKNGQDFKYKRFVPKAKLFDTVLFEEGKVEQKLWPIHCVRDSWGAQFHPKLKLVPDSIRIRKGTLSHVDAYSAFWDNMRMNETGLRQELANKRVTDLFFCGLATDYCVAASALDATKAGFITFVIDDACRGIDEQEIDRRKQELLEHGAFIVKSDLAVNYLRSNAVRGDVSLDRKPSKHCLSRTLVKTITYRKAFC